VVLLVLLFLPVVLTRTFCTTPWPTCVRAIWTAIFLTIAHTSVLLLPTPTFAPGLRGRNRNVLTKLVQLRRAHRRSVASTTTRRFLWGGDEFFRLVQFCHSSQVHLAAGRQCPAEVCWTSPLMVRIGTRPGFRPCPFHAGETTSGFLSEKDTNGFCYAILQVGPCQIFVKHWYNGYHFLFPRS
jgi:hypothetical protein